MLFGIVMELAKLLGYDFFGDIYKQQAFSFLGNIPAGLQAAN
jgi:hypothetical protein